MSSEAAIANAIPTPVAPPGAPLTTPKADGNFPTQAPPPGTGLGTPIATLIPTDGGDFKDMLRFKTVGDLWTSYQEAQKTLRERFGEKSQTPKAPTDYPALKGVSEAALKDLRDTAHKQGMSVSQWEVMNGVSSLIPPPAPNEKEAADQRNEALRAFIEGQETKNGIARTREQLALSQRVYDSLPESIRGLLPKADPMTTMLMHHFTGMLPHDAIPRANGANVLSSAMGAKNRLAEITQEMSKLSVMDNRREELLREYKSHISTLSDLGYDSLSDVR